MIAPGVHKALCLSCFKAHYNSPDKPMRCPSCGKLTIQFNGRLLKRKRRAAA